MSRKTNNKEILIIFLDAIALQIFSSNVESNYSSIDIEYKNNFEATDVKCTL